MTCFAPALHHVTQFDPQLPTLVVGHSLGSSARMWDSVFSGWSEPINVITYDLPGHGESSVIGIDGQVEAQPTIGQILKGLASSLDAQDVSEFHIAGLSFGGLVAMSAPHFLGDQIRSTTIMASQPKVGTAQAWQQRIDEVTADGLEPIIEPTMVRWFSEEFRATEKGAQEVARIADIYRQTDPVGYNQCCHILGTTDASQWLSDITCPVTVIAGEQDAGCDAKAATDLGKRINETAETVFVVTVPGTRHMFASEQPELVQSLLASTVIDAERV